MVKRKVVVVGAGIAGLGVAHSFKKRGYNVQVIEADSRVGGRAKTLIRKKTGDICDVGTQYYHSNYPRALGLIDEVGFKNTIHKIKGKTRFFDDRVDHFDSWRVTQYFLFPEPNDAFCDGRGGRVFIQWLYFI